MPRQLANGVRDEQPMGEHRGFFINSHMHPIWLGRAKARLMSQPTAGGGSDVADLGDG
jgi:hypothetical protein